MVVVVGRGGGGGGPIGFGILQMVVVLPTTGGYVGLVVTYDEY